WRRSRRRSRGCSRGGLGTRWRSPRRRRRRSRGGIVRCCSGCEERAEMKSGIAAGLGGVLSFAGPQVRAPAMGAPPSMRLENLRRAAQYPWTDDGACVVRESWGDWKTLIEHCYFALDHSRMRFRDVDHRCLVAQVDAATVEQVVAVCILVQPELV